MCKCTPFEETRFVTSSGAENRVTVYDSFVGSKMSKFYSFKFRLKQTYSYELQTWCLKIPACGPLYYYKIQAKTAEIRLPGVYHLLWKGMLAELICHESRVVCYTANILIFYCHCFCICFDHDSSWCTRSVRPASRRQYYRVIMGPEMQKWHNYEIHSGVFYCRWQF